jgi:DNA-binding winged helix-turn-helix (wHTH) protein/Tol biopolymer transport system component
MSNDQQPRLIRFGPFEADLHAGELRKNGTKMRLPQQPFQLLAMLLAQPGELVTREQLQKRLWADDTFVDFDRGLNKAVNRLREALGDSADRPRHIETLPKRGYRFIAAVDAAPSPVLKGTASPRRGVLRGASYWIGSVGVAAALAAALAGWLMIVHRTPEPLPFVRSSLLPPQGTSFAPHQFALSSDGMQLAFSAANADGTLGLWVRSLSAAAARRLDGTKGARYPFWSPDNRHIGFFADRQLETIDVIDGTVRTLCDARRPRGGTWNANDVIVFAPDVDAPLFRVPATGGAAQPVTQTSARALSHNWPVFLPDGRHFLFTAPESEGSGSRLYAASIDSIAPPTLVLDRVNGMVAYSSNQLFFVRDGTLMAQAFSPGRLRVTAPAVPLVEHEFAGDFEPSTPEFSAANGAVVIQSSRDFTSRLTWVDSDGRVIGAVGKPGDRDPALSPDGRLLATACASVTEQSSICLNDLERGVTTQLTHGGTDRFPVWSRDGRTLAFRATDAARLFEVSADASSPPRPIGDLRGVPSDWSNDGRLLFFRPEHGTVVLATYGATTHDVSGVGPGSEAQFSPDGHWLLYGGQDGIAVRRLPDGPRIQISAYGGSQPRWSRDARHIFYIDAPTRNLMSVDFDPATVRATPARILFQTRIVAPALAGFQYDVARDGRFLINSLPADSAPLTLLIGWTSRLN